MKMLKIALIMLVAMTPILAQGTSERLSLLEEIEKSSSIPSGMTGDTLDISYRDNVYYEPAYSNQSPPSLSKAEISERYTENNRSYNEETTNNFNSSYSNSNNDNSLLNDLISEWNRNRKQFKGHWAGAGFGLSNYVTGDLIFTLPDEIGYMTLNSGKSFNYQFNFTQLSMGLTRHLGFVTGLGLSWENFRFEGQNNIQKNYGERNTEFYFGNPETNAMIRKSTLNVAYLTLPFLVEIQLPAGWNTLNVGAGPIGSIKVGSWSKIVMENGEKFKNESDFNFNILMLGGTARVGFDDIQAYATYYITPLFYPEKTPGGVNLYPIEVGLIMSF